MIHVTTRQPYPVIIWANHDSQSCSTKHLGMMSKDPNHLPNIGHGTPSSARNANVPDELARFGRDRIFTVSGLCRQNTADISSYSWTCIFLYNMNKNQHYTGGVSWKSNTYKTGKSFKRIRRNLIASVLGLSPT